MKLKVRQFAFIVVVAAVGLLAWLFWPHKPLLIVKETRLAGSTNLAPVRTTGTGALIEARDPGPKREIVGIGIVLKSDKRSGAPQIADVLPNSPAWQFGLSAGLIIHGIDDVATEGLSLEDCARLIRGPLGTTVRLELIDPENNETYTVELTRQRVRI